MLTTKITKRDISKTLLNGIQNTLRIIFLRMNNKIISGFNEIVLKVKMLIS